MAVCVEVMTVVEERTKEAVLGIARTIVVRAKACVEPLVFAAGFVGLEGLSISSI